MRVPALVAKPSMIRDVLSREGAYLLCKQINAKWAVLGHIVNCRVEDVQGFKRHAGYWVIRSDMVDATPRKMANKLAA